MSRVAGTLIIALVIGLVLAVGAGLFVKKARVKANGSWAGPVAIGSIVGLIGIAVLAFSLLALVGMLQY